MHPTVLDQYCPEPRMDCQSSVHRLRMTEIRFKRLETSQVREFHRPAQLAAVSLVPTLYSYSSIAFLFTPSGLSK